MSTWVHLLHYSRFYLSGILFLLVFFYSLFIFKEEFWLAICRIISICMTDYTMYTVCCTWAARYNYTSKQALRAPHPAAITQEHIYHFAKRWLSLCPSEAWSGCRWQQIRQSTISPEDSCFTAEKHMWAASGHQPSMVAGLNKWFMNITLCSCEFAVATWFICCTI